jgi:hypothetical protein
MTPKMIDQYKTHLENEDLSTLTITGYLANTRPFLQWFEQSNSETSNLPTSPHRRARSGTCCRGTRTTRKPK